MENKRTTRRETFQGIVVSTKMDKTIIVSVDTHKTHHKYLKRLKFTTRLVAHDENNVAKVGDVVTIMKTRPLSKTKRFRLVRIDKKALESIKAAEAELKLEEKAEEVAQEATVAKEEVKAEVVEEVKAPEAAEAPKAKKKAAPKAKEEK